MRKSKNSSAVARIPIAETDDRQTTEQKMRLAVEKLFGKNYVFISDIPAFDEALFKRFAADQNLASVSSSAHAELLKHQEQVKAGQKPVWANRSLPVNRAEWNATDLVSAYYLACRS